IAILAPIVRGRKGHYRELFTQMAGKGFLKARIDGVIEDIYAGMQIDRYKVHNVELVVDRVMANDDSRERIETSMREAMRQGRSTMMVIDMDSGDLHYFSR
ncbi:MAG: excinuclease ABC subunit UvrA, partial [Mucinivorans sp.]